MNLIKKLALAATVVLIGATSVQAQQIAGSDTPVTQLNTYGGGNQWIFSDANLQVLDPIAQTFTDGPLDRTAGQTFIDAFILDVPDNEYVYFDFGNVRGSPPSVAFTELAIGYAYGTGPLVSDTAYATSPFSVTTGLLQLNSGTYEFDIYGTFTQTGGSFSGDVFGSAVPEPQNLVLMLAGLGLLGSMARRRGQARA